MARKKAVVDARIRRAQTHQGVVILLTGNGKGKSSSAFGTLARALGHGQRGAVVQFSKGRRETGEARFFRQHPAVDFHIMGAGFSWETQDRQRDCKAAQQAWEKAAEYLADPSWDLVLLDEITYQFKFGHLEVEPVLDALRRRPPKQNVILTGRSADLRLRELADTVSRIENLKHAFQAGIAGQAGVEW